MNSRKYSSARKVNFIAACVCAGFALAFGERVGRLEVKENIAKAVEERKAREQRTFVVEEEAIDIDDI